SECTCMADTPTGFDPMGAEDTCSRMGDVEGLQRADRLHNQKAFISSSEAGGHAQPEEVPAYEDEPGPRLEDLGRPQGPQLEGLGRPQGPQLEGLGRPQGPQLEGLGRPQGPQLEGLGRPQGPQQSPVSQLEEKVADALALLLQLRQQRPWRESHQGELSAPAPPETLEREPPGGANGTCRPAGNSSADAVGSRRKHGPAHMVQVADALCAQLQLSTNEIVQDEDGCLGANEESRGGGATFGSSPCQSTNTLLISC
ncbi:hypothetical protein NHX12_030714, partial [Muraenolepis orangiensis]